MKKCPLCAQIYTNNDFYCLRCNVKLEFLSESEQYITPVLEKNIPKCPICGSAQIHKISLVNKAGAVALFGVLSAGHVSKTFKCDNCGAKF